MSSDETTYDHCASQNETLSTTYMHLSDAAGYDGPPVSVSRANKIVIKRGQDTATQIPVVQREKPPLPTKKEKTGFRHDNEVVAYMQWFYDNGKTHPTFAEREEIATDLSLTQDQVNDWFNNTRKKFRNKELA